MKRYIHFTLLYPLHVFKLLSPKDTHPLLQQGPADGHPLLQVLDLPLVLRVGVDLDLALVGIEQLQLLLQLHPQHLVLCFLGLIQSQLRGEKKKGGSVTKKLGFGTRALAANCASVLTRAEQRS